MKLLAAYNRLTTLTKQLNMKKDFRFPGGSSSSNSASFLSTSKKKNPLKKLFTLGGVLGALFFSSCSSDSDIVNTEAEVKIDQNQVFTLVPAQEELIQIEGTLANGAEDSKRATQAPGNDRGRFNITLKYLVNVTERQNEVFQSAAARWERIIIKDNPSISAEIPSAFEGLPALTADGPIDDIVIEVVIGTIDGPGNVLGQAGPRYFRNSDFLPVSGIMYFDVDDLTFLDELDLFEEVIVHEMGHVLGIGTMWNFGRTLREGPTTNPYFTGKMANTFWNAEGGNDFLPIENQGGRGTAGSHWRESLLRNELMTGYINLGENPLSRITAGSLRDMGYGTAVVGEQYELQRGTPGVDINELAKSGAYNGLHIAEMETILEPVGVVNVK